PIAFAVGPASTLTIGLCPTVVAGDDQSVCAGGTASLSGSEAHASGTTWSTAGDGTFGDSSLLSTTYTPGVNDIAAGSVVLTLTGGPTAPCQLATDDSLVLTIQQQPAATAGSDQALCNGSTADLLGQTQFSSGCTWTTAGDGSFNDASSLTPTYSPGSGDIAAGHATLTLTCAGIAPCVTPANSTVTITWTPGAADGDMNGDGQTNGADIPQFIAAVIGQSHAAADVCPGDFTLNGVVQDDDLPGMVNRLLGN
ncbi:MAG TPA: hypothetical protein VMV81_09525, partial [Phycisphaerae bacterium]|nr:hypothetical protein [Phycisphaerae bacterium]